MLHEKVTTFLPCPAIGTMLFLRDNRPTAARDTSKASMAGVILGDFPVGFSIACHTVSHVCHRHQVPTTNDQLLGLWVWRLELAALTPAHPRKPPPQGGDKVREITAASHQILYIEVAGVLLRYFRLPLAGAHQRSAVVKEGVEETGRGGSRYSPNLMFRLGQ